MRHQRVSVILGLFDLLLIAVLAGCGPCEESERGETFPELSGPYLGQTPPGDEPMIFAPGIVSTGLFTRDLAMTPDGNEIYFSVVLGDHDYFAIMVTRQVGGRWTEPEVAPFSGEYNDLEPAISPGGETFYFFSYRPREGGGEAREDSDLWAMDRSGDGWGEPYNLGEPVNSDGSEYFPSVTSDGTIYFCRDGENRSSWVYRARRSGDGWAEPERLGPEVNSTQAQFNAYVSPDESFLIFGAAGRADSLGGPDYYVSFRDDEDRWTGPINLGPKINSESRFEYSPYVTPDGQYFFFMAARSRFEENRPAKPLTMRDLLKIHAGPDGGQPGIWWVDAGFIRELRPQ